MIDILGPVTPARHGGCLECDPTDPRSEDDDIYVFLLGGLKVRLCRQHASMLRQSLERSMTKESRVL